MTLYQIVDEFREKIDRGQSVLGPFMKTGDPAFVEAAGYAGFDFVILDQEHGPVGVENMQNNVRGAQVSGTLPIIRVENISEGSIGKALDIGALGIQVPQVTDAGQAEAAVHMAKFYPEGERGVCRFVRAARYSALEKEKYFRRANKTLVILQLEGLEALENLDSIMAIEGIDILFIGPYDLSQSLGVPGETSNPKVLNKMEYITGKARKQDIVVGTFVDRPGDVRSWADFGVQYISFSVDVGIFYEACREIVDLK